MTLEHFGWADPFETAFASLGDDTLVPARVISAQREHYRLRTEHGLAPAAISGKFRQTSGAKGLPCVGDWVAVKLAEDGAYATIQALLPRRSALTRQQAGGTSALQVIAANVDLVFLVSSLNHDWNPRRVERALALTWEAGAQPVLLLTKLDLCPDPSAQLAEASAVALGVPVHALSVHDRRGLSALDAYLTPGRTVVLIGSSGVGKSTLVNHLLGESRAAISDIRAGDDRGKHTTTHRELFELPSGALLIDTPGMRELGLHGETHAGLESTFRDVEQLAQACRFHDCGHHQEPGCAVRAALEQRTLDPARLAAYHKLRREEAHQARRHDQRLQIDHQRERRKVYRQRKQDQRSHPKR